MYLSGEALILIDVNTYKKIENLGVGDFIVDPMRKCLVRVVDIKKRRINFENKDEIYHPIVLRKHFFGKTPISPLILLGDMRLCFLETNNNYIYVTLYNMSHTRDYIDNSERDFYNIVLEDRCESICVSGLILKNDVS